MELIRREGPITFYDWMHAALYDPVAGYYRRADLERWGRAGDYRTSPERSELFAATFARYFAKLYDDLERPREWIIVECGAGDGRFAAGVLRSLADDFPRVFEATRYVVCDLSSDALQRARRRLREFEARVEFWSKADIPPVDCGIVFSNELLDAFPVRRLMMTDDGLREMLVDVHDEKFAWTTGQLFTLTASPVKLVKGQIIEVSPGVEAWLREVVARLANGFVVTVDYGAEAEELYDPAMRPQGTLRAYSRHGFVDDVLAQPGDYDITASVNWTQVKQAGKELGLKVVEFASQDRFLLDSGLLEVLEQRLTKLDSEAAKLSLTTGVREMILPGGMGSSFQVLVQAKAD